MTKKRLEFKCWNCAQTYTLLPTITPDQVLIVACPYCNKEGVVRLEPFRREITQSLKQDGDASDTSLAIGYEFPPVIPTEKPS